MNKRYLAYLSALGAAFFYSLNQIYSKRLVKLLGALASLVLIYAVLVVLDFLICYLFGDFSIPSQRVFFEIILLSLVSASAMFFLLKGLGYLPVGINVTLANLSPIFLTIFTLLSTGKLPPPEKLFSIFLLLFSIYLVTFDEGGKKGHSRWAYLYPLLTAVGWGFSGWETYRLVNQYNVNPLGLAFYTSLYMFVIFFASLLGIYGKKGLQILKKGIKNTSTLKWAFLVGVITSMGYILSIVAFKWVPPEEAPVIEATFAVSTPLSAILSYFLLGETLNSRQILGVSLSFLSLVLFFLS
ncbi:MAG TPA: DMT family transporter [Aquificales bacterium]|nr:DMT family transporter [Aquificales bacterium]